MLTDEEGSIAVRFAREIALSSIRNGSYSIPDIQLPKVFEEKAGAFVTALLLPDRRLRGCIGIPEPIYTLRQTLVNAAVDAVLSDPRFEPVREEEIEKLLIEVTVLTPPVLLSVRNPWELPMQVVVGRDGLIVERGRFRGLLLPQVAVEEGWDSEEFLENTCWKAGLPQDAWMDMRTKVYVFQGEIFSEEQPGGNVRRKSLSGEEGEISHQ